MRWIFDEDGPDERPKKGPYQWIAAMRSIEAHPEVAGRVLCPTCGDISLAFDKSQAPRLITAKCAKLGCLEFKTGTDLLPTEHPKKT